MAMSTQEFVYRRNVVNYMRQLRDAGDDDRRKLLLTLLAEEAAKARLAGWMPLIGPEPTDCAAATP